MIAHVICNNSVTFCKDYFFGAYRVYYSRASNSFNPSPVLGVFSLWTNQFMVYKLESSVGRKLLPTVSSHIYTYL